MNTKKLCLLLFGLLFLSSPLLSADECPILDGDYQMNTTGLSISQSRCTSLSWRWRDLVSDTPDRYVEYVTDNVERETSDDFDPAQRIHRRSRFEGAKLVVEDRYLETGGSRIRLRYYFLSQKPCGLSNPSGTYLVRETTLDGVPQRCALWRKRGS